MASKNITIDFKQMDDFFTQIEALSNGAFKNDLIKFLEGIGIEFLRIVEDEIINRQVVNTRLLLKSFHKGAEGNVWISRDNGLTLEVGTNIEYASYVNDGHLTNPSGVDARWVPGYWNGDDFIYTPGAKTGMLLRQQRIEGKHYWESAIRIIERMMPTLLDKKLEQWFKSYFGV